MKNLVKELKARGKYSLARQVVAFTIDVKMIKKELKNILKNLDIPLAGKDAKMGKIGQRRLFSPGRGATITAKKDIVGEKSVTISFKSGGPLKIDPDIAIWVREFEKELKKTGWDFYTWPTNAFTIKEQ